SAMALPFDSLLKSRATSNRKAERLVAWNHDASPVTRQLQCDPRGILRLLSQVLVIRVDKLTHQRQTFLRQLGRGIAVPWFRKQAQITGTPVRFRTPVGGRPSPHRTHRNWSVPFCGL